MTKGSARLWLLFALFSLSRAAVTPFLGLYALELGGGPLLIGLIYALYPAASIFLKLPTGVLADRYGRRWFARMGYAAIFTGMLAYYLAPIPELLVVGSLIRGIGFGMFHPTMMTIAAEREEERERGRLGYVLTGPPIGMIFGPIAGSLIAHLWGYRQIFLFSSAVSACALFLTTGLEETLPGERDGGEFRRLVPGIMRRRFLGLLMARFTMSYAMGVVVTFIPIMAKSVLGFERTFVGTLFTVAAIFNTFGRPSADLLKRRIGLGRAGSTALVVSSISAIAYSSITALGVWLGMPLYGFSYGLFIPITVYLVSAWFASEQRATAMAIVTMMFDAGMTAGAYLSAVLLPLLGYPGIFAFASILNLASLTFFALALDAGLKPRREL